MKNKIITKTKLTNKVTHKHITPVMSIQSWKDLVEKANNRQQTENYTCVTMSGEGVKMEG